MAKSVNKVLGGIFCCHQHQPKPWCDDCPYEQVYDCRNILQNDISYWAQKGKLEVGFDGVWGLKAEYSHPKNKRKGRRFVDEERRPNTRWVEE